MGQALPKQYLQLAGRTVIEWSLGALLECEWLDGLVLVLAPDDGRFADLPVARHPRVHVIYSGGAERADSVMAGLRAVDGYVRSGDVSVLVHDAARPCVSAAEIEALCAQAVERDGGLLALPVVDTLKQADGQRVAMTADRTVFWRAQTPQLFPLASLMDALQRARVAGEFITDEASAMEWAGYRPRLVHGRESNLKVTYPDDLPLAAFWLTQREHLRVGRGVAQ